MTRSPLSKTPKQVFFNPINIFDILLHTLLLFYNLLFSFNVKFRYSGLILGGTKPVTQKEIFDHLGMNCLRNAWCGYNVSLLAYGQTGSGKSYTITGPSGGRLIKGREQEEGLVPRLCRKLFILLKAQQNSNKTNKATNNTNNATNNVDETFVELSYLELYNEKLQDLLLYNNKEQRNDLPKNNSKQLRLIEHPEYGVTVRNLSKHVVSTFEEVSLLLEDGNRIRTMAATAKNATSSRSHAICQLHITRRTNNGKATIIKRSKINIVDLAGSENASVHDTEYKLSQSKASRGRSGSLKKWNERISESAAINKSLLTLGTCIKALVEKSDQASENEERNVEMKEQLKTKVR